MNNGYNFLNGSSYTNSNNNENDLYKSLQKFLGQEPLKGLNNDKSDANDRVNNSFTTFEINSKEEIEYIKPETSGRLQMVYCRPEKRVYVGRYNFAKQAMDWESYISEGEITLAKNNDNNEHIGKVAEALVAIVNRLEIMQTEIREIKEMPLNNEKDTLNEMSDILKELKYKQAEMDMIDMIDKTQKEESVNNRDTNGRFKKKGEK